MGATFMITTANCWSSDANKEIVDDTFAPKAEKRHRPECQI